MPPLSATTIAAVNLLAFLSSFILTAAGVIASLNSRCFHALRWPIVFAGLAVMAVSLAGFVGAWRTFAGLLRIYLVSLAVLIVLVIGLGFLTFFVTRHSGAYDVQGYRLGGHSPWLGEYVTRSDNWGMIKACLVERHICSKLNKEYLTADQFFSARISPLQSGCCKPTTTCGYTYVNPTTWDRPTNATADSDCCVWNNNLKRLCYNCNSCKAGFLGFLREQWGKSHNYFIILMVITVLVLVWVYIVAHVAYKEARFDESLRRPRQRGNDNVQSWWMGVPSLSPSPHPPI